jgi:hypothetical protein
MAMQYSQAVIHARLDAVESTTGTTAKLQLRTGAQPANCAAAATGTLLRELTLPSDWMNAASAGTKTKLGTWTDSAVGAAGTVAHFRIVDNAGTTCHIQGTVTATGGGGDMTVDNAVIATSQTITVNTFTLNGANA